MPRAVVYTAVSTNTKLHTLGYAAAEVYGSASMENTKADKFIVLRWGQETPAFGVIGTEFLTVWVYDKSNSYTDINKALKIIRDEILLPMIHRVGSSGSGVSQVSFNGFSEDLYDDMFKRITRNGVFTINTHHAS